MNLFTNAEISSHYKPHINHSCIIVYIHVVACIYICRSECMMYWLCLHLSYTCWDSLTLPNKTTMVVFVEFLRQAWISRSNFNSPNQKQIPDYLAHYPSHIYPPPSRHKSWISSPFWWGEMDGKFHIGG